jgi:hypothetical protein
VSGNKAFAVLSAVAVIVLGILSVLGTALAGNGEAKEPREGGAVVPCSLAGVNPAYHPQIFGNAATAATYGFVQSRDGTWHVAPGCRR